jgi:peptidyl-prolyl cis-trans isomerase B (cyclophilin B)
MKRKKQMKKINFFRTIIGMATAFALCITLASCAPAAQTPSDSAVGSVVPSETGDVPADSQGGETGDKPIVEITMENGGVITLELDPEAAPITVANFLKLVNEGFYDGLTFHRIVPNFMIQGGDPLGNGTGGSEEYIKGEFSANGVDNPISHARGVISMARAQDPNSARSQFFITNMNKPDLDGNYAAFGTVIAGLDVVDEISAVPTDSKDHPLEPVVIKTIKEVK